MSAYAALVSLQQIAESILDPRSFWNFHNRAQLDSLFVKVTFFLDFLDNSSAYKSTQISSLEAKMRDAAYKTEDLIESQISRILESNRRSRRLLVLMVESIVNFCVVFLVLRDNVVKIFMLAIAIAAILAVGLNLALRASNYWDFNGARAQEAQKLRLVLYDMNFIADKVIRAKEECVHELEMSAYASLLSLRLILDSVLESGVAWRYHNRAQLDSLHEKVAFLLEFLGNASANSMASRALEAAIADVVYKAQQLVEFEIPSAGILESEMASFRAIEILMLPTLVLCFVCAGIAIITARHLMTKLLAGSIFVLTVGIVYGVVVLGNISIVVRRRAMINPGKHENQELHLVIDDFGIIVKDVITIKDACGDLNNFPAAAAAAAASSSTRRDLEGSGRDVVVGLDNDLIEIKARLLQDSSNRELVSIVGMGGIGKTTLARQAFKDPAILTHFDVCAWVTVSHEYSLRNVLLCLLDCTQMLTEEKRRDNEEELGVYLHQYLTGRRYLIVMDDVWDTDIWDFLSRFLPENNNGSRVLLTSRLPNVVSCLDSGSPLHHMQCLDENESWDLLREKIFGEEGCPLDLEFIGKEIATSCRGLPLAIVVIAGLLYEAIEMEVWRDVAEKLKESRLEDIKEHCLGILGLSYNHLPHHLRPCFLYMGVFPADCEISISRLINLWVAEGFLKPQKSKTLEEVAESYLEDLINRNLILVRKRSCSGKMRTCSIHDLLRDVCVQNASKENFLHVVDSMGNLTRDRPDESSRRLSIHSDALLQVNDRTSCYDNVRSVLCVAGKPVDNPLGAYSRFVYLRVLNVLGVHFTEFPHQIIKLVHLRYLALHYDGPLPGSISKLQNLETIVHHSSFRNYPLLPRVIWSMPNLRHIYVKPGCYLFNPLGYRLPLSFSFLPNLQTLVGIRNFKWTKGIIKHVPNLKKLSIFYHVSSCADLLAYQLETLVSLHQLESVKIICKYDNDDVRSATFDDLPKLAFPQKLRKLSLSGCRFPWESMAAIGALPNLEALKLRREAFCGPSWETVEGEFPQLVFLLLEEISFSRWECDESHFPRLQRLAIRSCHMLEEIPYGIGDIPTLEMINLADCQPSAVASAKQILKDQESMGNETLKLVIERRREVDEVNLENSDPRGTEPRAFQIVRDSLLNAGNEIMLLVSLLMIRWPILSKKVKYHLGSQRSS